MRNISKYYLLVVGIIGLTFSIMSYSISGSSDNTQDIVKIRTALNGDLIEVERILSDYPSTDFSELEELQNSNWYINIFEGDSLVFWNQVDQKALSLDQSEYKSVKYENEDYTYLLSPNIYDTNRHIKTSINKKLNLKNELILPNNLPLQDINSISKLEIVSVRPNRYFSLFRFALFILSYIVLLHTVFQYCKSIQDPLKSVVVHAALNLSFLLILQVIGLQKYFDPLVAFKTIHISSFWVSSIAELFLLNLTAGYVVVHLSQKAKYIKISKKYNGYCYSLASIFLGMGIFYLCHIASGIITHPTIHLDIDNILLFDKYSLIVIVLLLVQSLLLFTTTCCIVFIASEVKISNKLIYYILGLVVSTSAYFLFAINIPLWILLTYIIVYLMMLDLFVEHRSNSIIWLIWWMVLFSSFMAGIVFYNSLQENIHERKEFVKNLYKSANQDDIAQVIDLNQSIMSSQIFSKLSQLPHGKLERKDLVDYLRQNISIDEQIPTKRIHLECFDVNKSSLFKTYGIPYNQLKSQLDRSISINEFIKYNPYTQTYYLYYLVNNDIHSNAPFDLVVILNPTKNQLENTLPKFNFYAILNNEIILKENPNTQEISLDKILATKSDTIVDGYSYVTHDLANDIRIVNYKRISSLIKPISLFSYIFSILGLLIIFIGIINSKYRFLGDPLDIQFYAKNSLRTKIQLVIIVLVVFSFLIIGLMTGYYFNNLLKNNQSKTHREQIIRINNSIQSYVNNIEDEESKIITLSHSINQIKDIHGQELSLYSRDGSLISFTDIEEDMIRLPVDYSNITVQTKDIDYKGITKTIVPISTSNARPYAYVTISFAQSPRSYNSILDFISTILNVYVFLFLIAGAIALAIANSITRPLSIIAGKLKEFKLGASNEPLIYEDNDEIGQLIHEYNNLIVQVQDSAEIIAKTERDMAWREMAKQVAHEIKNPLTPMKLSIQYLDKMVKTNPDRAKDITEKVASTLVNQIDALTNIANEFSSYATMPKANNEKIILNEIVEAVHDLFRKRDDMEITMSEPIEDLIVFVDRNQLIRILNNLVKNAIQAIPDNRRGKIDIALHTKQHIAIISVKDNGTGIADFMKQKVFTPNFTTKNSGTGLGLAISANMIDSMNGKIYFETVIDKGTTFFVEIPMMRSDEKISTNENSKRVSLDD